MSRFDLIGPDGVSHAWAARWITSGIHHKGLVAAPRLHLSYDLTLDLCAGKPYAEAFRFLRHRNSGFKTFMLHSSFEMWRTGAPVLAQTCLVLLDPEQPFGLDELGGLVTSGRKLLETLLD